MVAALVNWFSLAWPTSFHRYVAASLSDSSIISVASRFSVLVSDVWVRCRQYSSAARIVALTTLAEWLRRPSLYRHSTPVRTSSTRMAMDPERPRMAAAMSLESFVARGAYFVGAVQMALALALGAAAAVWVAVAWAGPPAVSAAVAATDVTASARAAGFLASALRMPVFMTDIYIGPVRLVTGF